MPYPNEGLKGLENTLGIRFDDPVILQQALTHRSYLNEQGSMSLISYERLEYLGDSFLGWVVAAELFKRYPEFSEGALTVARSQLVRGEYLAGFARSINLGSYLAMGQGEEKSGGRDRNSNLAAALESLIAAVLIDQGHDRAYKLIVDWISDDLNSFPLNGPKLDSKSNLQEILQEKGLSLPSYSVSLTKSVDTKPTFFARVILNGEEIGTGSGNKKSQAEQQAALNALHKLNGSS